MIRAFLLALVIVAATAACSSGPTPTPTPIGDATVDAATVDRLLTKDDIKAVGGSVDGLKAGVQDLVPTIKDLNPDELQGISSWFTKAIAALDRPGILMTVKRYDDPTGALAELDSIDAGGAFTLMKSPIGDRSSFSKGNPEQGAAIVFVLNRFIVTLQCPSASDGTILLTDDQLIELAKRVEHRL